MKLKVIIQNGEQGGLIGSIPALPGCRSQASTRQELLDNLREAAELWLEVEQDKAEGSNPLDVELIQI